MPKTIKDNLQVTRKLVKKAAAADRGKSGTLTGGKKAK